MSTDRAMQKEWRQGYVDLETLLKDCPLPSRRPCHAIPNVVRILHTSQELLLDALLSRRDIVFDGTLSWAPFVQQTVAMVRGTSTHQYQRGPGYRKGDDGLVREEYWTRKEELPVACIPYLVEMVGVTVNPEVAVQRCVRKGPFRPHARALYPTGGYLGPHRSRPPHCRGLGRAGQSLRNQIFFG